MSLRRRVEQWDANRGIPRPADAPHLPAYQAFLRIARDSGEALVLITCGFISAGLLWLSANNLEATGEARLIFAALMFVGVFISILDASQLFMAYLRFSQRVTHGSAMWADVSWLKQEGLVPLHAGELNPGELRLGTLTTGHDLVLPDSHTTRHIALFGPPGSGKSATFLMTFIRDWAGTGSVIVLDPKGELFAQTASSFKRVFRLDLSDPKLSDRWNPVPYCKGNAEFAHELASIIIGLDTTKFSTDSDKFWQVSEVAALTAILLHLPCIAHEPTPAMINEFIASRELDPKPGQEISPMAKEMMNSPDPDARLYWGTFSKAKREVQGGILTGLSVKCAPFSTPHVKAVCTRQPKVPNAVIDQRLLRDAGTAINVVIPEGDAHRYSTFLTTFFGLAVDVLRKSPVDKKTVTSLFVFDEAGNIPIHGLKEMVGVGRGRKVGIVLGYQNIAQVSAQYGREGADAILGSIGTMIFLPGLDDRTARYAAGRIGKTTVLQHTTVDGSGTKYDNERLAETSRDLIDHSELRQLVRHTQAVAIIDTVPPIKFRFPHLALTRSVTHPTAIGHVEPLTLKQAEDEFKLTEPPEDKDPQDQKPDVKPATRPDDNNAQDPNGDRNQ